MTDDLHAAPAMTPPDRAARALLAALLKAMEA